MAKDSNRIEEIFDNAVKLPPEERIPYLDKACGGDLNLRREIEKLLRADDHAAGFLSGVVPIPTISTNPTSLDEFLLRRPPPPIIHQGQTVGDYRILESIGSGGMGSVFSAERLLPEERTTYLDKPCVGDLNIRREVEEFLRAVDHAPEFLDSVAPPSTLPTNSTSLREFPQRHTPSPILLQDQIVGDYRILESIGSGGMGSVFRAERIDEGPADIVAIKFYHHDPHNAELLNRFEFERMTLAQLSHPRIASLLDAGRTTEGIPYVVMEYVNGKSISEYSDSVSNAKKVDLILETCSAVAAAHAQLIVHRDIKPENILVDSEGHVKLLDFGIAKWIEGRTPEQTAITATAHPPFTPAYASPEQWNGDRVTVAIDIYQIGVVLYELLTQKRLYSGTPGEIRTAVIKGEPRSLREIRPDIPTDLEAIVMKAIRVEPEKRYLTIEAMANDLRDFRQGLPVDARQGNRFYSAQKFLNRHWPALSTTLLVITLIATFTISTFRQMQQNFDTMNRLFEFKAAVEDMFMTTSSFSAGDRRFFVQDLFERGTKILEDGIVEDSRTRILLQTILGRIALHTGDAVGAQQQLEGALKALREHPEDPLLEIQYLQASSDIAMAMLYQDEKRFFALAEQRALEALEEGRRLWQEKNPYLDQEGLVRLLNNLSTIYCWQGKWEDAEPYVDEAFGFLEDSWTVQHAIAITMKAQITYYLPEETEQSQAAAQAQSLYQEALKIYLQVEGESHPDVPTLYGEIGLIYRESGDLQKAEEHLRNALITRKKIYNPGYWGISMDHYNLALIYRRMNRPENAEIEMRQALEIYLADHELAQLDRTHMMRFYLAEIYVNLGRIDEAQSILNDVPRVWWEKKEEEEADFSLALGKRSRGYVLATQSRSQAAQELLQESLNYFRAGSYPSKVAASYLDAISQKNP